jgi:hypothetical protein
MGRGQAASRLKRDHFSSPAWRSGDRIPLSQLFMFAPIGIRNKINIRMS